MSSGHILRLNLILNRCLVLASSQTSQKRSYSKHVTASALSMNEGEGAHQHSTR